MFKNLLIVSAVALGLGVLASSCDVESACEGVVCVGENTTCVDGDCLCLDGFVSIPGSDDCEPIQGDPCEDVDCGEHGTCVNGTCECDLGYTGAECDEEIRAAFYNQQILGTETVVCDDPANSYTEPDVASLIVAGPEVTQVYWVRWETDSILVNVTSATEFSIPSQNVNDVQYNGSGTLETNTLTVNLTETSTDFGTCQVTYVATY